MTMTDLELENERLKLELKLLKEKIAHSEQYDIRCRVVTNKHGEVFLYLLNKSIHATITFDPAECPDEAVVCLADRKQSDLNLELRQQKLPEEKKDYKITMFNSFSQLSEIFQIVFKSVKEEIPLFDELNKFDANVSKYPDE